VKLARGHGLPIASCPAGEPIRKSLGAKMTELRIDARKAERLITQTLLDEKGIPPADAAAAAASICRRLTTVMPTSPSLDCCTLARLCLRAGAPRPGHQLQPLPASMQGERLLSIRLCGGGRPWEASFRSWHKADMPACPRECPFTGVERKSPWSGRTDANDPNPT
jgi:hypothetical protein